MCLTAWRQPASISVPRRPAISLTTRAVQHPFCRPPPRLSASRSALERHAIRKGGCRCAVPCLKPRPPSPHPLAKDAMQDAQQWQFSATLDCARLAQAWAAALVRGQRYTTVHLHEHGFVSGQRLLLSMGHVRRILLENLQRSREDCVALRRQQTMFMESSGVLACKFEKNSRSCRGRRENIASLKRPPWMHRIGMLQKGSA
jgi:hypothetical protein